MVHITIAVKCTKATKIELLLAWLGPSIDLSCTNVVPNILMYSLAKVATLKSSGEGCRFGSESLHLILLLYFFSKMQKKIHVVVWFCISKHLAWFYTSTIYKKYLCSGKTPVFYTVVIFWKMNCSVWAVLVKKRVFLRNFWVWFFQFFVVIKKLKHCSVRTKMLHNISSLSHKKNIFVIVYLKKWPPFLKC